LVVTVSRPPMDFGLSVLLAVFLVALVAGFAGSMVGVGGGIFLVPFLTLVLGLDVRMAIATSLIGVIATSSGAASVYVRDRLTNLRLGMFLEVATSLGAILGAFVAAVYLGPVVLQVVFGIVAVYAALFMLRTREGARERAALAPEEPGLAKTLNLSSYYFDPEDRAVYRYRVARPGAGFAVSAVAGALSGLLGVGGGFVKVPAMNLLMRVPMKVAVATSNLMIGVTAAASAFVYYSHGYVQPTLAAVVILGVFLGTLVGTRVLQRLPAAWVRAVFAVILVAVGIAMALSGLGVV